jgi:acetolactate synthase-1/2/3 large subunit
LPPDEALGQAARLLQSARRPVLLLGVAAGGSAATGAIRRLIRKAALPVACTFEGNGVVPRDLLDRFIGRVGYAHNQPADRLLQQADVVACVGYDLIEYDPTDWLGPATSVIHLDEIPATIDRAYRPVVELVGDLGRTIDALAERLGQVAAEETELIREAQAQLDDEQSRGASLGGCPIHPLRILHDLGQVVGDDMTITCDVGAHQIWTARYLFRFAPRRLFFSMGHQTMGVGLPWAIGAALARRGESAVSISGDGSFLMTATELETAVRLKLPTVHLVWRDGSYNLVGLLALREYGREFGTHFGPTDFVGLAHSLGAAGFRVNDADEFRPTLERALALKSPVVIEIPIDYRENLPLVQPMRLRAVD